MKRFLPVNAIALGLLALASPAVYANINLVPNGSFESSSALPQGYPNTTAGQGTCLVPGWTCSVPAGNVGGASDNVGLWTVQYGPTGAFFGGNFIQDPLTGHSPDAAGSDALYLVDDGTNGSPITETVSQTINVVTGHTYNVGFDVFYVANSTGNPYQSTASLSLDVGPLFTATTGSFPVVAGQWTNFNALYTATATGSVPFTITYEGGTYTGQDLLLDRAYATLTPEPGFYGALALGMSGLLFAIQRRRRA